MKYRVWVITNVPNKARYYEVMSPHEGKRMIDAIADEHLLVPDDIISSNAFGLHVLQNGVWEEWEDEYGNDICGAFENV